MSTRCNIVMKESGLKPLYFYRHSDGYPEVTGKSITKFVKGYTEGKMRLDLGQSAGWLIVQGHKEYLRETFTGEPSAEGHSGWKVGAYEPTDGLHGDIEYVYIINLDKRTLEIREGQSEEGKLLDMIVF